MQKVSAKQEHAAQRIHESTDALHESRCTYPSHHVGGSPYHCMTLSALQYRPNREHTIQVVATSLSLWLEDVLVWLSNGSLDCIGCVAV